MTEQPQATRADAFLSLKWEGTESPQPQPNAPRRLAPFEVELAEGVFQQRDLGGSVDKTAGHTATLADAIRCSPKHWIEPIEIWWSGRRWIVIDGHHRLKAYRQLQRDPKRPLKTIRVPVKVFEGTLAKAVARSAEGNSRDKLPMTEEEKSNAAWRMVCMDEMTKAEIAAASSRSGATIARMRRTHRALLKMIQQGGLKGMTDGCLINLTWEEATMAERDEELPERDDQWVERQARAWAWELRRSFKDKPTKSPEIFARAIEVYSAGLPRRLIESPMWSDVRQDLEDDEAAERAWARGEELESDF